MSATASTTVNEASVEVAGRAIHLLQDGTGPPLLVLHHSTGNLGWIPLYERLAERFAVTVPDMPGYGRSERPEWAREPRDLAILLVRLLDRLDVDTTTLVGLGFGGYVAAEMSTMAQSRVRSMVLVGAAGIQPDEGEIYDQVMVSHEQYVRDSFRDSGAFDAQFGGEVPDEAKQLWDFSREMTARVTWKPYMFSRRLPHLLTEVTTPTLLVWGRHDRIVPVDCARKYGEALPNARLEIVEDAGHAVDMEQPETLARLIAAHAGTD